MKHLEEALGAALMLLILADIFLTVLYARSDTGVLSKRLAMATLAVFRPVAKSFGKARGTVLSFCAPTILVLLVLVWFFGLSLGAGLIMHPRLGTSIRASSGETPTDFATAVFVGGSSISLVGGGSYGPQSGAMRMFFLLNSIIGTSVVSLTLAYLMQIYTALQRRNAFGLKVHLLSRVTGDAAVLLAALAPRGKSDGVQSTISELATSMSEIKESHHFYPVLFFFRFQEPYYSVSRTAQTALDLVALVNTALDDKELGWLKETAAAAQLRSASLLVLHMLEDTFLEGHAGKGEASAATQREDEWRRHYCVALQQLRAAGIPSTTEERQGEADYVAQRREWDADVRELGHALGYARSEVDPTLAASS